MLEITRVEEKAQDAQRMGRQRDLRPAARSGRPSFWSRLRGNFHRNAALFLMALPGLAHVILFRYVTLPFIIVAFLKFRVTAGLWGSEWVWFKNFGFLFGATGKGWQIVRNVVLYNTAFIVLGTVLAVAVAVLLNEVYKSTLAKFYQTSLFFPQFISWVIVAYVGYAFLDRDSGMINGTLTALGREPVDWYTSPQYWPLIIFITFTWRNLGISTVMYLAEVLRINPEYFEAASLDGAGKWRQIIHITLPSLRPLMTVLILISIGSILSTDFGLFYQMPRQYANQVLIRTTDVIDTYVLRALRTGGQIELATAAGLYQSAVGFLLVTVANWIVRKIEPERALF